MNIFILVVTTFYLYLLIGLTCAEYIERGNNYESQILIMAKRTLLLIIVVYSVLIYIGGVLMGIFPMVSSLLITLTILSMIQVTPFVALLILIPPLVGYIPKLRPKWDALRERIPFWGIYLGVIAGSLTLAIPLTSPELAIFFESMFRIVVMGGLLIIVSVIPLIIKSKSLEVVKLVGVFQVFFGILLWFGALGGFGIGSILSIIAGAYTYDWRPYVLNESNNSKVVGP